MGSGRDLRGRGRGHDGCADRRLEEGGGADKQGPQDRDTGARSWQRAEAPTGEAQMAEGGGESSRARELALTGGADLLGSEGAWPRWAGLG